MKKGTMVECLVNYFDNGNKSHFAKRLGLRAQTISGWIKRDTFDAELIYSKCQGVSGDWLLSGEGEMLRPQCSQNVDFLSSDVTTKELFFLCKSLIQNYQQRDEVMAKLISMVKKINV